MIADKDYDPMHDNTLYHCVVQLVMTNYCSKRGSIITIYIYIGSYLEGNKYGKDVGHKEKSFVEDKHTNDPSDAHYEEQSYTGLQPMPIT